MISVLVKRILLYAYSAQGLKCIINVREAIGVVL
uniref:Uncharacterized protein n=1 Tax=Rhizophora mucronata TaxID=61149 RepID=A0A2P2PKE8_RHIMU